MVKFEFEWMPAGNRLINNFEFRPQNPNKNSNQNPNQLGLARQKMKHFRRAGNTLALAERNNGPSGIHQMRVRGLSQICQPGETVNNRRKFGTKTASENSFPGDPLFLHFN